MMASIQRMKGRPAMTTVLATAIVAAAMLVVPVSYQRTTGQEVLLTVSGAGLNEAQAGRIANELETALEADEVALAISKPLPATVAAAASADPAVAGSQPPPPDRSSTSARPKPCYEFTARVSSQPRADIEAAAAAFARILAERGMDAEVAVTSIREEVSGNVYAMALDRALEIRVSREGKTVDELAEEIRAHLADAGLPNPQVTVSEDGTMMKIAITACGDEIPCEDPPDINLSIDGLDMDSPDAHKIAVCRTPDMTDEDVIAEVKRQLLAQGVDAEVTIVDGRIQIEIKE